MQTKAAAGKQKQMETQSAGLVARGTRWREGGVRGLPTESPELRADVNIHRSIKYCRQSEGMT